MPIGYAIATYDPTAVLGEMERDLSIAYSLMAGFGMFLIAVLVGLAVRDSKRK